MFLWQFAHAGFMRCCSIRWRSELDCDAAAASGNSGTFGGGGGGGVPRICSRTHLPRLTGDVRVGLDVTVRMLPCVINPARSFGREARTNASPRIGWPPGFGLFSPIRLPLVSAMP